MKPAAEAEVFSSLEKVLQDRHLLVEEALRRALPVGESPEVLAAAMDSLWRRRSGSDRSSHCSWPRCSAAIRVRFCRLLAPSRWRTPRAWFSTTCPLWTTASSGADARPATSARQAVMAYAKNLGLAFQIVDDLIDATGASAEAGKDVGKDLKRTTFVSFAGGAGARQLAAEFETTGRPRALWGCGPAAQESGPLCDREKEVGMRERGGQA